MQKDAKRALVTGVTGQDGSYLAELLLAKGYEVHGLRRRTSLFNTARIDHIFQDRHDPDVRFHLHYSDMTDSLSIMRILADVRPDEIYNMAAQAHVGISFENPEFTSQVNAIGTLRLLEAIRALNLQDKTRFYQASTSELFGMAQESVQNEKTPFHPRSPYAVAKLYAYWATINYREAYGLHASNGILFNHESPRRGENYVTRKITRGITRYVHGLGPQLNMGNIEALRDWGHAREYIEAAWMMTQQDTPDDYVIATGQQHSVRDFLLWAAADCGLGIEFEGKGSNEIAVITSVDKDKAPLVKPGDVLMRIDPNIYRPTEVDALCGDATKAKRQFGWHPKTSARELCTCMVEADLESARAELRQLGRA